MKRVSCFIFINGTYSESRLIGVAMAVLPHTQSALMHNLEFYRNFMVELRKAVMFDSGEDFLKRHVPERQAKLLISAIKGDE